MDRCNGDVSRTIENKRVSFRWTGDVSCHAVGGRRRSQPISEWQFGPLFVCLDPSSDHSSDQRPLDGVNRSFELIQDSERFLEPCMERRGSKYPERWGRYVAPRRMSICIHG